MSLDSRDRTTDDSEVTMGSRLSKLLEQLSKESVNAVIPTGFTNLDRLLCGLQCSDLIILGSRTGMGKSALALDIACNAASNDAVVAIFNLQMSGRQVALRMLAKEAEVDLHRLRLGLYTDAEGERIKDAKNSLSRLPIYVDDTPSQSIGEIRSKVNIPYQRKLDLLIVDYIQLLKKTPKAGKIAYSLKEMARDLNIPVLALSQLNRSVDTRPDHRPLLSDLSGSDIEEYADVVAFIYRADAYYTEEKWEMNFPYIPYPRGLTEIIVAKHRHGPLDTISLYFQARLACFENMDIQKTEY